jgi:hypothetical protein
MHMDVCDERVTGVPRRSEDDGTRDAERVPAVAGMSGDA